MLSPPFYNDDVIAVEVSRRILAKKKYKGVIAVFKEQLFGIHFFNVYSINK